MGAEEEEQKATELIENPPTSGSGSQPMTPAQFLAWKQLKDAESSARKAEAERKRAEAVLAGEEAMNGRELFLHQPWVFDNTLY